MLYQGWNLITMPVEHDYTAKTLGENISGCSIVSYYNASTGAFQSFVIGTSPPSLDFAIADGVGYFVYMNCRRIFSVVDTPISDVSVDLYAGWNTIGWYNATATNASSLGNAIDNCTIVSTWNASSDTFSSYVIGVSPPSYDFPIRQGMGIFVYVTKAGTWHGEGSRLHERSEMPS
jgi:hypothetical protein